MKKIVPLMSFACAAMFSSIAAADERGTEAEAQVLVGKVVAAMKADGVDTVLKAINDRAPKMEKGDLFVFVYDFKGVMLAHGKNQKMVGKNLYEMKDVDGMSLGKGMIDMVREKKKGWYGPYRFANPQTTNYEYKKTYCELGVGETLACVGVYLGTTKP